MAPIVVIRVLMTVLLLFIACVTSFVVNKKQLRELSPMFCRLFLATIGYYHVPVKNIKAIKKAKDEGAITIFNHNTAMDGLFLIGFVFPFAFAVNSVHMSNFLIHNICSKLNCLSINRAIDNKVTGGQADAIVK